MKKKHAQAIFFVLIALALLALGFGIELHNSIHDFYFPETTTPAPQ